MISTNSSIGTLEKQMRVIKAALVENGYVAYFDVFRSGRISDTPSYVEINALKNNTLSFHLKIHANGVGKVVKWNHVKTPALRAIKKGLDFECS